MHAFIIFPLLALIFTEMSAVYILAQNWRNPVNRAYMAYCVAFGCWLTVQILQLLPLTDPNPVWLLKADNFSYMAFGFLFLNFVYRLLNRRIDWAFIGTVLVLVVGYSLNCTSLLVPAVKHTPYGILPVPGPLYAPAAITFGCVFGIFPVLLLFREYVRTKEVIRKKQFMALIFGTLLGLLLGWIFDAGLQLFLQPESYSFVPSILVVQMLVVFLATIRYRFLAMEVSDIANDLFATIEEGVIALSSQGRILRLNPFAERLLKKASGGPLEGRLFSEVVPGVDDSRHYKNQLFRIAAEGGKEKEINLTTAPIINRGVEYGRIAIFQDVSDRENVQRQMLVATKLAAIGELTAGVAHEINNPLTVLIGNVDILRRQFEKRGIADPSLDQILEKMDRTIQRITKIVKTLRNYSRDSGDKNVEFDVHEAIKETFFLIESIYSKENIKLSFTLDASSSRVSGNPGRFNQVLMNLIANARDALSGREDPEIKVSTESESESGNLLIRITDNGPGISPEVRAKLFTPFFTTKPAGKGTGLGLSISHSIVFSMGGAIRVEPGQGRGTTFVVRVPFLK